MKNRNPKQEELKDMNEIDIYQNELDLRYSHSVLLKLVVLSGVNYQKFPPSLRNLAARLLYKKKHQKYRDFPIDTKVDSLKLKKFKKKPFDDRFAVCFTHDIDTRYGLEKGMDFLRKVEVKHGILSTWTVVPKSKEYRIDVNKLKKLQEQGNEIAVHGLYHDGKFAFVNSEERERRIRQGKEILESMGFVINGFRVPWANRTRDLIHLLEKYGYTWDSSFPDTDPSTIGYEGTGCSTVFPFYPLIYENGRYRYSKVLELPMTIPQDWTLIHSLRYSDEEILDLWKKKVEYIESIGGLALFLTHPDDYDLGNPDRIWVYEEIIEYVKEKNPVIGTCKQICELWRKGCRDM